MLHYEKTLTTLQKLGLTYYGAKVYATLISLGPSNAVRLSIESEVPRSKVYDVLRRLEAEGWISIERSRPIIYSAKHPKDMLEGRKAAFNSEVDDTSNELSMLYDRMTDKEVPKVWLIRGMDNITTKMLDMVGRAKKSVMLLGPFYSKKEIGKIKEELVRANRRGLNVRVMTQRSVKLKDGKLDILENLSPAVGEIKISGPPFHQFVIIDDREVMIMFARVEDEVLDTSNVIAIWIPNASFSSYLESMFIGVWNVEMDI